MGTTRVKGMPGRKGLSRIQIIGARKWIYKEEVTAAVDGGCKSESVQRRRVTVVKGAVCTPRRPGDTPTITGGTAEAWWWWFIVTWEWLRPVDGGS